MDSSLITEAFTSIEWYRAYMDVLAAYRNNQRQAHALHSLEIRKDFNGITLNY